MVLASKKWTISLRWGTCLYQWDLWSNSQCRLSTAELPVEVPLSWSDQLTNYINLSSTGLAKLQKLKQKFTNPDDIDWLYIQRKNGSLMTKKKSKIQKFVDILEMLHFTSWCCRCWWDTDESYPSEWVSRLEWSQVSPGVSCTSSYQHCHSNNNNIRQ